MLGIAAWCYIVIISVTSYWNKRDAVDVEAWYLVRCSLTLGCFWLTSARTPLLASLNSSSSFSFMLRRNRVCIFSLFCYFIIYICLAPKIKSCIVFLLTRAVISLLLSKSESRHKSIYSRMWRNSTFLCWSWLRGWVLLYTLLLRLNSRTFVLFLLTQNWTLRMSSFLFGLFHFILSSIQFATLIVLIAIMFVGWPCCLLILCIFNRLVNLGSPGFGKVIAMRTSLQQHF